MSLSDLTPQNSDQLQAALQQAAEWKAKAIATQRAAETLKAKAQALKDRAQQALDSNKELSGSLQRARSEVLRQQTHSKELAAERDEARELLAAAQQERLSMQSRLSTVEQQLALYVRAFEESKNGSDYEQIQKAIRSVMGNPSAEDALQQQLDQAREALRQAHEEKLSLQKEVDWYKDQASHLMEELSAKDQLLEDKEREYFSLYGELDLTKSLIREMGQASEGHESMLRNQRLEHQKVLDLLHEKERELLDKESELEAAEADARRLVEEFHQEAESLREEIGILTTEKLELEQQVEQGAEAIQELERMKWIVKLLEDQRSDLEIVNADLMKKIARLESGF